MGECLWGVRPQIESSPLVYLRVCSQVPVSGPVTFSAGLAVTAGQTLITGDSSIVGDIQVTTSGPMARAGDARN